MDGRDGEGIAGLDDTRRIAWRGLGELSGGYWMELAAGKIDIGQS